jgi:hypothetical protein
MRVTLPTVIDLFNRYDQPYSQVGAPAWLYRVLSRSRMVASGRCFAVQLDLTSRDFDTDISVIRADWRLLCNLAERTVAVVERAVMLHIDYRTQ